MRRGTSEIERERKYELNAKAGIPRLAGVGEVRTQEAPVERTLDAVYYDTADFRLARAGITLRRRTGGTDAGWHVKIPLAADTRRELRLPLGEKTKVPGRMAKLVRAFTLDAKLRPVARLRTDRFAHRLADAEGRTLAVLADDHVTGEVGGGQTLRLDRWRELEVELDPEAAPGLLGELDRAVRKSGAEDAWWPSKLRRLIGDEVPERRRAGSRSAHGVVYAYLGEQFERLRRADLGVRTGTEDSVHQMRVAARKLRSTLKTFKSFVDTKAAAGLTAELKWLGAELAPARDAEVTGARLGDRLDEVPPGLLSGPLRQYVTRRFARESESGLARVTEALAGKRYIALLQSMAELLETAPPAGKAGRKALRKPVRKAARKLRRAEAATRGLTGDELEKALHEVRKKAKRARYAADAVRPVFGKKLRVWRKHLKAAQSTLGEHQDTVVERAALRQLAIAGFGENQNTFTFGLIHGRDEAEAAALRNRFAAEWRTLTKRKRPTWLKV
ncbi:CHAD domain-containing protein [Amycolatopsis sp. NPDC059021]|uniref:CYTH and CHAD domain-containing protein n=1 Tax=Amycolatopsis sp. NPDC059021 TaxID=3346704 RepID=UPI00366BF67B